MNYLAYLLCAVLIFPAVLLAGLLAAIRTATADTKTFWGFLWQLFMGFLDMLDSPLRLLAVLAAIVAFFALGAVEAIRVPAHFLIAALGVAASAYCLWVMGNKALEMSVFFVPSLVGAGLSIWFVFKR